MALTQSEIHAIAEELGKQLAVSDHFDYLARRLVARSLKELSLQLDLFADQIAEREV